MGRNNQTICKLATIINEDGHLKTLRIGNEILKGKKSLEQAQGIMDKLYDFPVTVLEVENRGKWDGNIVIGGKVVPDDLLKMMEENHLTVTTVRSRVNKCGWSIRDACMVKNGGKRELNKKPIMQTIYDQEVKHVSKAPEVKKWFMPISEVEEKYGKAGEHRFYKGGEKW